MVVYCAQSSVGRKVGLTPIFAQRHTDQDFRLDIAVPRGLAMALDDDLEKGSLTPVSFLRF